jgi:hypothetical protein
MSDCAVTHFGILTDGAFSVCFRRGVGFGGGAPALPQEEVKPYMVVTKVEEDGKETPISITIKRLT